ncbi:hypothetical protein A2976_00840 [candidate division WWE3 bacterium RIFCSPLOWO2_01_FULL_41_9]|uniref:Uncharacterized protein n=1 Tax=candidate division WWE3 bacterium RIFCSPLOWO2_01_FULL_41_9 TaxID=1802626 RepID=A0A1F4VJE7_UNCKA|nr:MAG: hypothetical protein A2976_00840 [candidate division WWE3 bacterium RIFCSPLOWO2_01_FULL_41_9]
MNEDTTDDEEKKKLKEIDVRTFAKHILKFGSNQERREIFTLIKQPLYLKNMKLYLTKLPKN